MASFKRSCHCTHACPSRVHCSNDEASSHLEQSNSPVVNCSKQFTVGQPSTLKLKAIPLFGRGPAKHQTTECSKLTPLFGRRPHEAGIEPTSSKPTKLLTTFRLEATGGSRTSHTQPSCCPPPRESLMPSHPPYKYSPCQLIDP